MLRLEDVHTFYGNIEALKGISLEVMRGDVVTLIGANGAGKTTTLMSISGVTPPRSGRIFFKDRPIHGMRPEKIVEMGLVQVPEGRRIFPGLTVMENLEMGSYLRKDDYGIRNDLEYAFALFPILEKRLGQLGGTLSGGEQQMLAISRALMARPELLILDEPSLGLAPLYVQRIFEVIRKINAEHGTTVLLVEQNAHMALRVAKKGYVMENGRITLKDRAEALAQNEEVRRAYLGI